jgi:hypothetical protein
MALSGRMINMINAMLAGAIAMASIIISLFFLRFWSSTRDRFFLYFSLSFLLEAINRIFLGITALANEDTPTYYIIRLIAYLLIIIAIVDKNRQQSKSKWALRQDDYLNNHQAMGWFVRLKRAFNKIREVQYAE